MAYRRLFYAPALLWLAACTTPTKPEAALPMEFGPSTNGLIYSPQTMGQLRHIVDSLNLRHKVCELHPSYRSLRQGQASYVYLDSSDLKQARQALEQGITPEAFGARFPRATVVNDLHLTSYQSQGWDGDEPEAYTVYGTIPLHNQVEYEFRVPGPWPRQSPAAGRWIINYQPKTDYSGAQLQAFYLPAPLTQTTLATPYARLVQYADCLIDTTSQIYLAAAQRRRPYDEKTPPALHTFLTYAHEQTQRPNDDYHEEQTNAEREAQWRALREWDSLRLGRTDRLARTTPRFRMLLVQAATDTASIGATNEEFEEYVARYYSRRKALELKRSRRVVGFCSQDSGPRRHALSIATLSAETVNWETFLRAHLDIMNDRFERQSDGSYAQAERQTYLRELEELDINVPDLMLGISLRIDHAGRNHYYGSIGRLSRALAETRQPRQFEQRLLGLITDPRLDTYNRLMAYYLFLGYNRNLTNEAQQKLNVARLNTAVQKLPPCLVAHAVVKDEE
ncbi:hypothetical protein Q5H93_13225 [Hymenobacter sp. ASUV-10]|uniref:Uncharacterized protein n=1 Tax=Hymenobacter aranciens TaxID=3063996 RepID=A0ABT9BBQ6_9BACT|nr:hypothetical protein [Hymenobacter sp. ASUV-10]MDO7875700.1 hypothetical protein [Hymenobacter sp. ASUV-10]